MTKIVAVTGGTGFVGQHLITVLMAQGFQVRALTRKPQPALPEPDPSKSGRSGVVWVPGDLADEAALADLVRGCDVVFHLAGLIKARRKADFDQVNSAGVKKLLDIIKNTPTRPHFILLSSLAAREPDLSAYAHSKHRGEEMVINHAAPLPWTIVRPAGIYGPHDRETLKIFKALLWHIALLPGGRQNRASWIYAPDLARGLVALMGCKAALGKILDMDDGAKGGHSNLAFYETAARVLNIRAYYPVVVPKPVLFAFAQINVLFSTIFRYSPMITPDKVVELCHPDWVCRDRTIRTITDWKPQMPLKQGFEKTLKWYKENSFIARGKK